MTKAIEFERVGKSLLLVYSPRDGADWIRAKLSNADSHTIQNTFTVRKRHIIAPLDRAEGGMLHVDLDEFEIRFKLAKLRDGYWVFNKNILGISFRLRIHESISLYHRDFTAVRNISIFRNIDKVVSGNDFVIGGNANDDDWLSEADFKLLVQTFPNTSELDKYAKAKISSILKERFDVQRNDERLYHAYVNRKPSVRNIPKMLKSIDRYEIEKYKDLHKHLEVMLNDENNYSEKEWQDQIVKFIIILFPKYLYAFSEAPVLDLQHEKIRALDFLLIDYSGNIDIVEIKKPFEKSLITHSGYRDNYIPLRELSGTIMQIEKYIFHLMKSGRKGEDRFNQRYKDRVHDSFKIKITNPKGMIISGRTNNLTHHQINDLEVIKRKYNNIVDIISYDDLLNRLDATVLRMQSESQ